MSFDIQLMIQRLKEEAEKNDASLNKFLINNNLPQHLVDNMKKGRIPNVETIYNFAQKVNCSVDYLLGRTNMKEFVKNPTAITRVPILSQEAAAGLGKQVTDNSFDPPEYKWFYEDQVPDNIDYGIIIEGDSMEPRFHSGQTIFVKLADDCNDSWFGIFCITDDDGVTKVVFKQKIMTGEYTYKLHSLNCKKYSDIINERCRCVAVLVD